MCEAREQRGLIIAATCRLKQKGKAWLVPSQSGKGISLEWNDSRSHLDTTKIVSGEMFGRGPSLHTKYFEPGAAGKELERIPYPKF